MDNNRKIEYSFITKYNGEIIVGKADLIFEHDEVDVGSLLHSKKKKIRKRSK